MVEKGNICGIINAFRSSLIRGLVFFTLTLFSCKKEQVTNDETFESIFETVFLNLRQNYMFSSQDKTNLDSLYLEYQPHFKRLSKNNPQDLVIAYAHLEEITKDVFDGHFQIEFKISPLKGKIIYPAYSRKVKQNHHPFDFFSTSNEYLQRIICDTVILDGNVLPFKIKIGELKNNKLYIALNKLSFSNRSKNDKAFSDLEQKLISSINNEKYEVIIFDLRNNIGGLIEDLSYFVGFFSDEKIHIGYNIYKLGYERLNYSKEVEAYVYPNRNHYYNKNKKKKIIVIVDNYTMSSAELLAVALTRVGNKTCIVGENTFGAMGIVSDKSVFSVGPYEVGGLMKVYSTSVVFKDVNKVLHENFGLPPDIKILYRRGVDDVLEFVKNVN